MIISLFGRALHSLLVYTAMGIFFPKPGLDLTNTFSDFAPGNVLVSLLAVAAVLLCRRAQDSHLIHTLERDSLTTSPRLTAAKVFVPFTCIIVVLLVSAGMIAVYFVQRMQNVLNTSGYNLDTITRYNLAHLQIQFLLGLLTLFFLMTLFLFFVYRHMNRMHYEANADSLASIWNRSGFFSLCRQILPKLPDIPEKSTYFVVLDIDHFKQINDTFGHPKSDKILCAVAQHLKDSFPEDTILGRIGGDEFAVLLTAPVSRIELEEILQILTAKIRSISCSGHRISCGLGAALKRAFVLPATLERVFVFFYTKFIHCNIMFFLLLDILLYGCLIKPYGAYIITLCPKVSVSKFVLQICVFIEYH